MKVLKHDKLLFELRRRRAEECFSVVNRGKLWYDCLSIEQLSELNDWYFAWLDVTETKVIPTKPEWLDKKLSREEITW